MDSPDSENQSTGGESLQDRLILARVLLAPKHGRDPAWPALAATGFFAVCAMTFAVTAIMTPSRDYSAPARQAAAP